MRRFGSCRVFIRTSPAASRYHRLQEFEVAQAIRERTRDQVSYGDRTQSIGQDDERNDEYM